MRAGAKGLYKRYVHVSLQLKTRWTARTFPHQQLIARERMPSKLVLEKNRKSSPLWGFPELISLCSCISDPLVHHGQHFGHTLHAMFNVHVLITNSILCMGKLADQPKEAFTAESIISFPSTSPANDLTPQGEKRTLSFFKIVADGTQSRGASCGQCCQYAMARIWGKSISVVSIPAQIQVQIQIW